MNELEVGLKKVDTLCVSCTGVRSRTDLTFSKSVALQLLVSSFSTSDVGDGIGVLL